MTDGMDFEEMPKKSYTRKPKTGLARHKTTKKAKVNNMSKDQFKKAKKAHKAEIARIKAQRAELKQDIKRHKLLIKQAKIVYKVSKMKASK